MEELKPCPFCGNEEDLEIYTQVGYFSTFENVRCPKCQAEGPAFECCHGDTTKSSLEARIEAIEAWNNRKG